MPTTINPYSKPDTVLLLDAVETDPFIDHSQYRPGSDLSEQFTAPATNWLDEASSARTALDTGELTLIWNIKSGESGVLIDHGNASTYSWRIDVAAGSVRCRSDGTTLLSLALPDLDASDRTFLISYCTHPDDGNLRHELLVWNLTTGALETAAATQPLVLAASTSDTLSVGAAYGGASPFTGGLDFRQVRIGRRFHSQAEQREDWIAQTTPPETTQVRRSAALVPDRATLDIASDGRFAGPAHLWSGHAFEQSDRRLIGPLLNLRVPDPLAIDHEYDTPTSAWWRAAPGDADVRLCVALLWCRPVPLKVNRARVRLFVRQQNPSNTVTAEVRYRMYSMAGLPVVGEPIGALTYHRTAAATCSTDHGSGAGEWLDLGALPLAIDELGMTWLVVGVSMDEGSPHVANTIVYVHAVTVEPYFEPADDGALDIAEL